MSTSSRAGSNPFPRSAVAKDPLKSLPNFLTESQVRARQLTHQFAEAFASPNRPEGRPIGIRGDIGSGKTHTIFQLQEKLVELIPSAKCIYAKSFGALTLENFYASVVAGNLGVEDFKNLASQHFLKLLRRSQAADAATGAEGELLTVVAEEAQRRLTQGDQQYLLALIQAEMIPAVRLKELRANEISELLDRDLTLAYSKVLDPKYGPLAVQWLRGQPLTDQQQRDIGVQTRIVTGADARNALTFLLKAYSLADVPLLLAIDEIERVVLTSDGQPDPVGRNLLKDIIESFAANSHMVIICGLREAWDSLTSDWFSRLSRNDVCDMTITNREASELLRVWEQRGNDSVFSAAAVSTLAEVAEHNPRRLLEVAHHSWDLWASAADPLITPATVRLATPRALGDTQRRDQATREVLRLAASIGLPATTVPKPAAYDLLIGAPAAPIACVKITTSVFKEDEIADIKDVIAARRDLLRAHPSASTAVILAGYSSPALVQELVASGETVIRFDDATFQTACAGFLRAANERATAPPPAAPPPQDDDRYGELLKRFDQVAQQSTLQVVELRRSLEALQQQKVERFEQGVATTSSGKLSDVLEQLTALLGTETSSSWRARDSLLPLLDQQQQLIKYAQFLDRVVHDSDISRQLEEYEYRIGQSYRSLGDGIEYQSALSRRLDLLREMRAAVNRGSGWIHRVQNTLRPRTVMGAAGLIGLLSWVAVVATNVVGDARTLASYRQALARLDAFAAQYDSWPLEAIPFTDYSTASSTFNGARAQTTATAYATLPSVRGSVGSLGVTDALAELGRRLGCSKVQAAPGSCTRHSDESNRDLFDTLSTQVSTAVREADAARTSSAISYHVTSTWQWAAASLALLVAYGYWNILMRRLRLRR